MTSQPDELKIDRSDGVLALTLNAPQRANALGPGLVEAMIDALSDTADIRACVIRSTGKSFCAGFDLAELDDLGDGDLLASFLRIETLLQTLHHAPFPTLALAQGNVIGAGADLFAACWQRVAEPGARFRMPGWHFEIALGTRRLARLVGTDAARDLLIDAQTIDASRAKAIGLASALAETDAWPGHISRFVARATVLSARAVGDLGRLTMTDSRSDDMAAIVATAGRPGLKARVAAHVARVARERAQRRRGA